MRMVYQTEAAECGLACLAMVADHHGHKIDINTLRHRASVSLRGVNLQKLIQLADQLKLSGRALKLDLSAVGKLRTPCILHWDMNHFVVLKKATARYLWVLDPSCGERKVNMDQASESFTGIALELSPTSGFERKDERKRLPLRAFWSRIQGLFPSLAKVFALSILLQLFVLAGPYYMQLVVDDVIVTGDRPLLIVLAIGFGLMMLIRVISEGLRGWVILHLGSMLNLQMATNLFRHLVYLPLAFFEKRHMGDVVSRFGSLRNIREVLARTFVETFIDGLMALLVLALMFFYSAWLTLVVLAAVVVYTILRIVTYSMLKERTEASIIAEAKEQSNFMETVRAMQGIKLAGIQGLRINLWQNNFADYINESFRVGRWSISYQAMNGLIFGLENVIVIYLAAMFVLEGSLTVGMVFAYMSYKGIFTQRISSLIQKAVELRMTTLHLERLSDIALAETESDGAENPEVELTGNLALKNVSFRYSESDPLIIENLGYEFHRGQSTAIVGVSGCGKSTLLKLMLGLFEPQTGRVLADQRDIRDIGLRNFREQIAAVMQDDQLMSGSIMENIAFFDTNIDMMRVIECADMAGIREEIEQMNMGFNSLISEMGSALAGGQKQRILLARALYRRPKILFLDEATSHLDIGIEQYVSSRIRELDITRILIAHRPETIKTADHVVRLENGKLVEVSEEFELSGSRYASA